MNLVDPILFQARYQPEAPALCAQGIDVVSYGRLAKQIESVARKAAAHGLKRCDVVALSIDHPLFHAPAILGLTRLGIAPVSVGMHKPPSGLKLDAVIKNTNYQFVSTARHLTFDESWITGDGASIETRRDPAEIDEVCRIVLTSGTAGEPKAVALTHRMVMARNARFEYVAGSRLPACSRLYMQMGLAAALGYQFLTSMLARGGTLFFHGENIEDTLRAFSIFRIEAMLATPTTLAQLLGLCDQHPSIDIHLDTILSGGGHLPRALAERTRPRLCSRLITGYGATETAISATALADRISHIAGAAGYVTPGIRIEIVDDTDRPLPVGTEGVVRIASDFAVGHYIDDPVESAKVFRNGWFYPGDLGSLTSDNLLIISGRQNDVLNAGGGKMAAEKVEAALVSFKGVNDAAVFMSTNPLGVEEVWAAITSPEDVDIEGLKAHCRSRMPLVFVPSRIVRLSALPINAMGKVDRSRLKDIVTATAGTD